MLPCVTTQEVTQYCGALWCVGVLIEERQLLYIYMYLGFLSLRHILQDQGSSKRTEQTNGAYICPFIAYRSPYVWFDLGSQAHLVSNGWWIHMSELHWTTSWDTCHRSFLTCLFELREGLLTLSFQCSATTLGGLRLLRPILSHSCKLLDPKGPQNIHKPLRMWNSY